MCNNGHFPPNIVTPAPEKRQDSPSDCGQKCSKSLPWMSYSGILICVERISMWLTIALAGITQAR